MDLVTWGLLGLAVVLAIALGATPLLVFRLVDSISERHTAQLDRLFVLQRADSMAEFAAMNTKLDRTRLEMARGEVIEGQPMGEVARIAKPRSNRLGIWSRFKSPAEADEGKG